MKKKTIILLFFIVIGFFCNGCAWHENATLATYNNFSKNSAMAWGGRNYVCQLFRKNNHYYFESRILESENSSGNRFVKYLGENIVFDDEKPFFDSDGRMHIKYRNNSGKACEASVPFGDFYGDKHISDILPYRRNNNQQYSSKYAAVAILKEEEAVVDAFLPTLQKHIRNNDADAISKMLIYPIHVSSPAIDDIWLENRHEFLKYVGAL